MSPVEMRDILRLKDQCMVAIEAGQSLRGDDVVRVLNRVKHERAVPKVLFCDNGKRVHQEDLVSET
jgi:hypothetical protein